MARRPYSTWVRPFRDSDIEVKIRWYPARPEDGTLPFPSAIASLDWHARPYLKAGVGEVFNRPRNYNRAKPIPGPRRTHVCGTREEHGQGGLFHDPRPPMIYQPSGLPLCCEPGRREAVVPVAVGVRSTHVTSHPYRSTVPVSVGVRSTHYTHTPRRSTVCAGCDAIRTRTIRSKPRRSTVGVSVNPVSLTTRRDPYRSTVHVACEPRSSWFRSYICTPLETTCGAALPSVFGHWCIYDGFRRGDSEIYEMGGWRMWPKLAAGEVRVRVELILGTTVAGTVRIWQGDECGAKALVEEFDHSELDIDHTFGAAAGRVWVELDELLTTGPLTLRIRVDG